MRHGLALAALLIPLAGCVVAPAPVAPYGGPGYPGGYPGGNPPGGYPGADAVYPGYAYNDGSPTLIVEGVTWPLVFWGGGWGYWDYYHRWHGAPPAVWRHLEGRMPGGVGLRAYGGGAWGRPAGGVGPEGHIYGPPGGFRPGATPVYPAYGGRPSAPPAYGGRAAFAPGAARPAYGGRPAAAAPAARSAAPARQGRDDHR